MVPPCNDCLTLSICLTFLQCPLRLIIMSLSCVAVRKKTGVFGGLVDKLLRQGLV